MTDHCLFCRIVHREIPVPRVFENQWAVGFSDINPQAPHHYLVIPKTHIASLADADDPALLGQLMHAVRALAQQQGLEGYRTVINTGESSGQTVFHLHVHVLAGRPLTWPPG